MPSAHIGPREVLRVALMRGALDGVRNDMARALAADAASPAALAALLQGLEGIGIDLSDARHVLGVRAEGEPREAEDTRRAEGGAACGEGARAQGMLPEAGPAGEGRERWFSTKENVAQSSSETASTSHAKPGAGRRRRRANRKLSKVRR
ncbi:hypothetical protein PsYK624_130930 [Phanerochaete sordida]|uniref:Uncharacterized protein n=1 Tax=Phanerochaete sordida TaxID=48140 RepID=A0A9P3GNX6_9APHY|nr:hypothetical protein PsYK624_130930 [Phanerochaete sordida]